ncbi:MAG: hypothetical protein R3300_17375 [Candidatus Promineifilaceae bacterium]|nr:hypothetical protein [Candidatus Promineifilaceae bacterium]
MENSTLNPSNSSATPVNRQKLLLVGLLALVLFVGLALGGGAPPADKLAVFGLGVALLAIVLGGFALAAWHLLLRPLPADHKNPAHQMMAAPYRRLLAALVGIAGINLVVGGFWDEVWHRQFGIPFGEDLFWRPHLLIYSSIIITVGLASLGFLDILRNGRGTWQQRFRAKPITGLLVLVGAFMLIALPADPAWHLLYGDDISAWSIPHIVLTFSFVLVMVLAMAIQLSTVPRRAWRPVWRLTGQDLLLVMVLAFVLLVTPQALTTDWDSGSVALLSQRPTWLLPAVITTLAVLVGTLANHALRAVGVASFVGFLALAIRLALIAAFDNPDLSVGSWISALPLVVALDLLYGWRQFRGRSVPAFVGVGLAATAGLALGTFSLINAFFPYPTIGPNNLIVMIGTGLIAALSAAWAGQTLGDALATGPKQVDEAPASLPSLGWIPPVAFVIMLGLILLFITTAQPPVT